MRSTKVNFIIFAFILIAAAILRFVGDVPGYPPYHSDDGITYSAASSMIVNGNLDPLRYDYPIITPMVNYIFYNSFFIPLEWSKVYIKNLINYPIGYIAIPKDGQKFKDFFYKSTLGERDINALYWGRIVTGYFGILVVCMTFLIARRFYGIKTGLISAFLIAINYRHILNSHLGLPDIYNAFFLMLALWFAWNVYERPSNKNYIIAALFAGLSFSTKYQFFSFTPLLLGHLINSFKETSWKSKLIFLFRPAAISVPIVILLTFAILNPYHLIKFEETKIWLTSVSGKYRTGRLTFDFYPYSYLYHIGIGGLASVLSVVGMFLAFFKKRIQTSFVLSITFLFLFVMTYYTGGGFYTRNFVTVIPLFLIFSAYTIAKVSEIKFFHLGNIFAVLLIMIIARGSLHDSFLLVTQYLRPWNYKVLESWTSKNLGAKDSVAAHPSVPIPDVVTNRIPYNFVNESFSLREFKDLGADFVISSLDWATTDFYSWMTQDTKTSFKYWNKPLNILESSYAAMSLRELSDYSIYSVVKPWQAPESNFVVSKIPEFVIGTKTVYETNMFPVPVITWTSEPIEVSKWDGFLISPKTSGAGKGYVYANFYSDLADIGNLSKRVAVRLSSRGENKNVIGEVPKGAKYMVIGFDTFESYKSKDELIGIDIYNTKVKEDFSGFNLNKIKLDDGVIFPNSHGNM